VTGVQTCALPIYLLDELGSAARILLDEPSGLDHFEQARLALEIYLVTYACTHADAADLARLEAAVEANGAAIGKGETFIATDVAFHRVMTEMTGNPIFLAMHDAIVEWIIHVRPVRHNTADNNRASHAQHRAILAAIRDRDTLAAIEAMRDHLGDSHARYSQRPSASPIGEPAGHP
jgi:DNA-binding FadR family transcriptional regulator